MELATTRTAVTAETSLPTGNVIRFKAEGLNRQRTGTHAKIALGCDSMVLAWGYTNIDRDEDRVRLANSAWRALPEALQAVYTNEAMTHDLGLFALQAWDAWVETEAPLMVVGNPNRVPVKFWLKPHISKGGGTILFGPPGKGKSYVAMLMAISIEMGLQGLWAADQAKVLFVNLERSAESIQQRLGSVNSALGIDPTNPLLILNARGKRLIDVAGVIERTVEKEGIEVVFIDSISRAGMGDLTENAPVNQMMDLMNGIAPSWLGLGHSPRGDDSHVYGGVHFDAAADIMIQQIADQRDKEMGVALKVTKSNDIGKQDLRLIALGFDDAGLCKVWQPGQTEFPELMLEGGPQLNRVERVIQYLQVAGKATTSEIADETALDAGNVSRLLHARHDIFYIHSKDGRKIFYAMRE